MFIKLESGEWLNTDKIVRVRVRSHPLADLEYDYQHLPEDALIWRAEADIELYSGYDGGEFDWYTIPIRQLTSKELAQKDCDEFCLRIQGIITDEAQR